MENEGRRRLNLHDVTGAFVLVKDELSMIMRVHVHSILRSLKVQKAQ